MPLRNKANQRPYSLNRERKSKATQRLQRYSTYIQHSKQYNTLFTFQRTSRKERRQSMYHSK